MNSSPSIWAIRVIVIGAFILTVWLAGPRAVEVLAARFDGGAANSPRVALDRVGFLDRPAWLEADQALLVEVAAALSPWLSDEIRILDEDASKELRDGLLTVPWVESARLERLFPDRFRLRLRLRRPVLRVHTHGDEPLCLVDADGVVLPFVDVALPKICLYAEGGPTGMEVVPGLSAPEPRVVCAAAIATEWRDRLAPAVPDCPELLEVDTTNLDQRWLRGPEYPEVRVLLERDDGAPVVFNYGRPVDSPLRRVAVETKARVLRDVLAKHAGLEGLTAGELRLQNRWAAYLQPRAEGAPDPYGSWSELLRPQGR